MCHALHGHGRGDGLQQPGGLRRQGYEGALADRLARAVADGDLPAQADPVALARFVMIVTEGQAVHASAGVSREALRQAAEIALAGFAAASGARPPEQATDPV
ncbi:hypothetical protein AB0877_26950 [Micromonospora sp. NPDC047644]|uniref:hypothetical protein n=1 Tax=Micromonospora sp. NPDC047644 TaxID=3157203 RepID=UPI003453352D